MEDDLNDKPDSTTQTSIQNADGLAMLGATQAVFVNQFTAVTGVGLIRLTMMEGMTPDVVFPRASFVLDAHGVEQLMGILQKAMSDAEKLKKS